MGVVIVLCGNGSPGIGYALTEYHRGRTRCSMVKTRAILGGVEAIRWNGGKVMRLVAGVSPSIFQATQTRVISEVILSNFPHRTVRWKDSLGKR